jgi:hypothetical protein
MDDGTTMRARVRGEGDPATESTTRMLVQSALCLVEDADEIRVGGGSWTPASAMGDLLLTRLTTRAGMSFELESTGSVGGGAPRTEPRRSRPPGTRVPERDVAHRVPDQ